MGLSRKDLLGIEDLSIEEINFILETAESFKEISKRDIKKVPTLRGKTVINLFFEPSTRTRTSFEIAAKRLSADAINIASAISSVTKGETLIDTAKNLQSMNPDVIVIRHSSAGAPHLVAKNVSASVINAGDGAHEHPTQALLDFLTIKENKGKFEGLKTAIIGDITHSRVARSDSIGLTKLGAKVVLAGPPTLIPKKVENYGVDITCNIREAVADADVIIMLRIQLERFKQANIPSIREYSAFYGLSKEVLKFAKKDVIIMHPGPLNRGVEISSDVADGDYSVILEQVENGAAVRMAILYLLAGGKNG